LIPNARHGANASYDAAADQAHDVHMVWPLVENNATSHGQLMLHARPVHEFVIVPSVNHAESSELTAFHDFTNLTDGRIETMGVAAQELDSISLRRFVHRITFGQSHRHRFFDDDVFLVPGRGDRMLGVQGTGGGDVEGVHVGAGAEIFDGGVSLGTILIAKLRHCVRAGIRGGCDFYEGQLGNRRQDLRACHA
jgi:hypothetical protein